MGRAPWEVVRRWQRERDGRHGGFAGVRQWPMVRDGTQQVPYALYEPEPLSPGPCIVSDQWLAHA